MKTAMFFVGLLLTVAGVAETCGQEGSDEKTATYDAQLAQQLGADEYGMRSYVLCVLLTGENDQKVTNQEERSKIFRGHFANMGRLAEQGKLVLAGPLMEAPPKRGIYIFNVSSPDEAEMLVKTDPAVKAGIFKYELTKFYGSAALLKLNEIHAKIQKTEIK